MAKIGLVIANNQNKEGKSNEKVNVERKSNEKVNNSKHRRVGSKQMEKENKLDSFSLDKDDLFLYILKVLNNILT